MNSAFRAADNMLPTPHGSFGPGSYASIMTTSAGLTSSAFQLASSVMSLQAEIWSALRSHRCSWFTPIRNSVSGLLVSLSPSGTSRSSLYSVLMGICHIYCMGFRDSVRVPTSTPRAGRASFTGRCLSAVHSWTVRLPRYIRQLLIDLHDAFPRNFRCTICQGDHRTARPARFAPCRHAFCRGCARDYVRSKLSERRLPVLCPTCMIEPERSNWLVGCKSRYHCSHMSWLMHALTALDDHLIARVQLSDSDRSALSELELSKFSVIIDCPRY